MQSAAESAAVRGFKFYVAEGRAASHNPRTNKVELACSKFRVYDGRGGKTRLVYRLLSGTSGVQTDTILRQARRLQVGALRCDGRVYTSTKIVHHGTGRFAITVRKQPAESHREPVWKVVSANVRFPFIRVSDVTLTDRRAPASVQSQSRSGTSHEAEAFHASPSLCFPSG